MKDDDGNFGEPGLNTRLVNGGRDQASFHGFVNPPVYHGSTVLYRTATELFDQRGKYRYGRTGTPTTEALENAIRDIEGKNCAGAVLLPSGLSAISTALLAVLASGDHLLVSDSVYRPTRIFCDDILARLGIETTYFDPLIGTDISKQIRSNTRAIFLEAPGSQSFEMQDVPGVASVAHDKGVAVLMDNSWATPFFFGALSKGVDLSICAGTKYISGHSDAMIGMVSANATYLPKLKETIYAMGLCVGPDVAYLTLRGMRTLGVRLARHYQSGLAIAEWLSRRPEVSRVLYPALETDPGYSIWQRDFTGASGLFSVILKPVPQAAVYRFVDALKLFGKGYSWGGFESLVIIFDCSDYRTATRWVPEGPALRFHVGLEDVEDLILDLEGAFKELAKMT